MAGPGDPVTQEKRYQQFPKEDRDYWQNGQNTSLTAAEQQALRKQAEEAGKYDKATKTSKDEYPPGVFDFFVDDGAIVANVKEYVAARLSPPGDIMGTPAPPRPLGGIVTNPSTPKNPKPPADQRPNDPTSPGWVCINRAEYMAALMRALGYPVREVTVRLTRSWTSGPPYMEAALQVWFNGRWHFVDPYSCHFDPAKILDVYSKFSDTHAYRWTWRTVPQSPDGWKPPDAWEDTGWKKLPDDDVGPDLEKRYHAAAARARPEAGELASLIGLDPDAAEVARAEAARSGLGISTRAEGVRLALVDTLGRVCEAGREEILGAFHIEGGSPAGWMKAWSEPELPFEPLTNPEAVFVGTRGMLAEWHELGVREMTLAVTGPEDSDVALDAVVSDAEHPVTVSGLAPSVRLIDGAAALRLRIVIDPADFAVAVAFASLLGRGAACPEDWAPLQAAAVAAADRRRPSLPPK